MVLSDYKSKQDTYPRYDFIVNSTVPIEIRLKIYKEFLLLVKQDCSVSISTKEPNQHLSGIDSSAISTSSNEQSSIYIGLSSNREQNRTEYEAIYKQWVDVLDLSLNLDDKWNGAYYFVFKRISREGKKNVLKQFIDKYQGSQFDINLAYGGGTTFRVTASTGHNKQELLIDYLPQLPTEREELKQAFAEYIKKPTG
jgi:hypothetical protein